jgi:hypothetical protein
MCWFAHDYHIANVIDLGLSDVRMQVEGIGTIKTVYQAKYKYELSSSQLSEISFKLKIN